MGYCESAINSNLILFKLALTSFRRAVKSSSRVETSKKLNNVIRLADRLEKLVVLCPNSGFNKRMYDELVTKRLKDAVVRMKNKTSVLSGSRKRHV